MIQPDSMTDDLMRVAKAFVSIHGARSIREWVKLTVFAKRPNIKQYLACQAG